MNFPLRPNQLSQSNVASMAIPVSSNPQNLIQWSVERFSELKIAITTAFGMEGCALIDMYSRITSSLTVAYIDTGFFFPETRQLIEKMKARYSDINFVKWESPVSVQEQSEKHGKTLWRENPNQCCKIRKVLPMARNIRNFEVWITAIRKTQTRHRSHIDVLSWDPNYSVIKFCPLAAWTRTNVWDYIQQNKVPFNQLHLQGYPSIGCFFCTRPVPGSKPTDDSRAGRWAGNTKTECGLHFRE